MAYVDTIANQAALLRADLNIQHIGAKRGKARGKHASGFAIFIVKALISSALKSKVKGNLARESVLARLQRFRS